MKAPDTPRRAGLPRLLAGRTIHEYGDLALLVECESTEEVLAITAAVRRAALPGVLDVVPASRTVLVTVAHPDLQAPTRHRVAELQVEPIATAVESDDVVIDVVYDGADLTAVAEFTGMDIAMVIAAHTGTPWRVGFSGFAPGFAYLIGGDHRLQVPRHTEPRTRVPTGAVALAGEFSGVYPRESPGGWQLIGHTKAVLWDVNRPEPALLRPGMRVRFRTVVDQP